MNQNRSKSTKKEDKRKSNNNNGRKCSTTGKKESKGKKFMNMLRPMKSSPSSSPKSPSSPQQRTETEAGSIITSVHLGPPGQVVPQAMGYFSPTSKKKKSPKKSPHHTERTNEVELASPSKEATAIGNFFAAPFRRKKTPPPSPVTAKHSPVRRPPAYVGSPANSGSVPSSGYKDDVEMPKCSAETVTITMRTECMSREKIEQPSCETVALSRERIDSSSKEVASKERASGKYFPRVSNRAPLKDPPSHLVPTIFEQINAPVRPVTENPKFIHKQAQARRRKIQADIVAARHEKNHILSSLPDTLPPSSSNDPSQIQSAPEFSNRNVSDAEKISEKNLPKSAKAIAGTANPKKNSKSTQDSKTDKTEKTDVTDVSAASPRKKKKSKKITAMTPQPTPPTPPPEPVFNPSAENISINVTMDNIAPQDEPVDAGCATAYAPVGGNAAGSALADENCQTAMKPVDLDTCQTAVKPVVLDDNCQTAMKPVSAAADANCQTAMKPVSAVDDGNCQTAMKPVTMEPLDAGTATAYKPVSPDDANCQTAMKPISANDGLVPVNFGTLPNNDDPGKSMLTAQTGHFNDSTPTAMLPASKMNAGASAMTAVNGTSMMTQTAVQALNEAAAAGASTMTAVGGKPRGGTSVMTALGNPPPTQSAITAIGGTPAPADAAYFGMK